jgi:hypothetical protein
MKMRIGIKRRQAKHKKKIRSESQKKFVKEPDDDECQHDEHDHGVCLDCGKDITNNLVGRAESASEGG